MKYLKYQLHFYQLQKPSCYYQYLEQWCLMHNQKYLL